ncbi:MAG: hypothetical protein IKU15_07005 [Clostridia bacterium]|nr:hypothetical protein [Clostridia bacterium]
MFNQIKKEVIELINTSTKIVTNKSKFTTCGVYMLYVDNFTDDKIIPIYIGQVKKGKNSRTFQHRYKEHVTQIMALNRYSYEVYKSNFIDNLYNKDILGNEYSFYDGKFKSCKIFKYMVEHKCKLSDLKMIILEEIDNELEIDRKELEYINKLHSIFFGFNQLKCVTEWKKDIDEETYYKYVIEDGKGILNYFEYGYTKFNYQKAYFHIESTNYPIELNNVIRALNDNYGNLLNNQLSQPDKERKILELIFPKQYQLYPLGETHTPFLFNDFYEDNTCHINIEFSMHKKRWIGYYISPEITKIEYMFTENGKKVEKHIFTNTTLDAFFEDDTLQYWEMKNRGPFYLHISNHKGTIISEKMEYHNGINELTLKGQQKQKYEKALLEINEIINNDTKIIYTTSGYKSEIFDFLKSRKLKNTLLVEKLKKCLR